MKKIRYLYLAKALGIIPIASILAIGFYFLILDLPESKQELADENKSSLKLVSSNTNNSSYDAINQSTEKTTEQTEKKYADGSYTANQSYKVPGNQNNILTATIEIREGSLIKVSTTSTHSSSSDEYNKDFSSNLENKVVGKKIDNLTLTVVGGASLTSDAFNLILDKIRDLSSTKQ